MDFDSKLLEDSLSKLPDIKQLKIDRNKDIVDLCTDAIGSVIPFITIVKTSISAYAHYKERKFAKRSLIFLASLADAEIPHESIDGFIKDLQKYTGENGYDTIVGMLDRLDNENKSYILSNLVRNCAEKKFTAPKFLRVANALEKVPYSDLKNLSKYTENHYEEGESEILATSGLIIQTNIAAGIWDNGEDGGYKYGLSKLGENMLRFGFESSDFEYQGVGVNIELNSISESEIESIIDGTYNRL